MRVTDNGSEARTAVFLARLGEDRARLPGTGYLDYLSGVSDPDLGSTILMEIPSYDDPEIVNTVRSAIAMAANPDRIRFAICLQDDDMDVLHRLGAVPGCRVKHFAVADAPGTCAARYECQQLYGGEDFVFHTDAHMRFARYWDVAMIDQWRRCGDPKAILSTWALWLQPDELSLPVDDDRFVLAVPMGSNRLAGRIYPFEGPREILPYWFEKGRWDLTAVFGGGFFYDGMPRKGALICAHYVFGPGSIDVDVPVDKYMDFTGDEVPVAVRYYTHGYNIYHPSVLCAYHLWPADAAAAYGTGSRHVDGDRVVVGGAMTRKARQTRRVEKLLGIAGHPDIDLGEFGLGTERTLEEYEAYSGISFRMAEIARFAERGDFGLDHTDADRLPADWQSKLEKQRGPEALNWYKEFIMENNRRDPAWPDKVGMPGAQAKFMAKLRYEMLLTPGSGYLEYVKGIESPDLDSTILVEIPSYDDPDVVNTVRAALAMAANPNRVRFAVCLQDDDQKRIDGLAAIPCVRLKHYALKDAPGACAARYECHLMYGGEDFVLHTDAHMRFARFWDVASIEQWESCGDATAVLSNYAKAFKSDMLGLPVDDAAFTGLASVGGKILTASLFAKDRPEASLRVGAVGFEGPAPRPGAFIAAGWLFCRGEADERVPVDPKMHFFGDEMGMCVRYWTHGFNLYHFGVEFVFHLYADERVKSGWGDEYNARIRSESAMTDDGLSRSSRELHRMEKLLGIRDWPDTDLGEFGLGSVRTLGEYQAFCGVDFRNMTIRNFAARGQFGQAHDGPDDMDCFDWGAVYERQQAKRGKAGTPLHVTTGAVRVPAADADAFRKVLEAEAARLSGVPYLEYLKGIESPDLTSTILIEMPAYCDPDVLNTIAAARAMAANPERIRFAVCLQDDDKGKLEALRRTPGCRVRYYPKADAPGTCGARYECQRLYDGEDFVLHTDAHMRFAWGWDVAMIGQWSLCGNERAVLTDYATGTGQDWMSCPVDDDAYTRRATMACGVIHALYFQNNSPELRMQVQKLCVVEGVPPRPILGAFVCAHCMFGRPLMDQAVPIDPKMDFTADESPMAVRLWTHGFDIWHTGARCVFHAYAPPKAPGHTHEASDAVVDGGITRRERQVRRLEKLLGVYDRQDVDLSGFDLGTVRSLKAYQEFSGVDFRDMTIRRFAVTGFFGTAHRDADMEFVDWTKAFEEKHGTPFPDRGRKLDLNVRPDAAEEFLRLCADRHVHPQAALTEAIRLWTDNRKRGRF